QDENLMEIFRFLNSLIIPEEKKTLQQRRRFIQKAQKFFVKDGAMFKRRGTNIPVKVIFRQIRRQKILEEAHE
ncbi:hypothetical protein BDW22DRAFT_1296430, partial [Trametopsis cervina]